MTIRQKILKFIYPGWMAVNRLFQRRSRILSNKKNLRPFQSFYSLSARLNNGNMFSFDALRGKKVLLVNTASDCGYTNQYAELQKLYEEYSDKLVVIGFPANDFKHQEKGNDEQIARFCQLNFGVTFLLAVKAQVIKGRQQQEVYRWLTDKQKNGWNSRQPSWNFSKYLVDEEGLLIGYFDPAVSPLGHELRQAISDVRSAH